MKKALLIIGIAIVVACAVALIMALFFRFSYYHVLDGSQALHDRLYRRMIMSFITAGVFAVIAVLCFVVRSKM
ncbi:MAG: hypothetical protein IKT20_04260 [Clostridiales bacterium]|nr:hypothetical protein [Clostridiales bacterium]MBR6488099.1 hypothetical protein [Clostridiales bacterium]